MGLATRLLTDAMDKFNFAMAKVSKTPEVKTGGPGDPVPQADALSRI